MNKRKRLYPLSNEQGADIVTRDYLDMKLKEQENRLVWKMLALFIAFAALIKWL